MNTVFKRQSIILATITLVFGTGLTTTAVAQDSEEALEEIVVTGSRIVRRDFVSPSPIVTLEAEAFEERVNIGLEATLNQLPQFTVADAGTQAQGSTAGTPFPASEAAPGAATVNLRALGTNRSLILVNGRRLQPVNGALVVDLNTIPAAAIASVETITGGAAAVYGADAIAGVINLKLKDDFEGMALETQYGMSQEGDGDEFQINGLFGADFADGDGNLMLGINYAKRKGIKSKDRDFVREGWDDPGTAAGGLNGSPLSMFVISSGNAPSVGFPLSGGGSAYAIDQNGNLFDPQDPLNASNPYTGPLGGSSGFKVNPTGDLGFIDRENANLQIPLERYALFGNAEYSLSDGLNVFVQTHFSETNTTAQGTTSGLFNVWEPTIPYNSQYDDPNSPDFGQNPSGVHHPVPAGLATILNSRPVHTYCLGAFAGGAASCGAPGTATTATGNSALVGTINPNTGPDQPWTYRGGLDYLGPFTTETTGNVYQVVAGVNGDIAGTPDWTYEIYVSHGKSTVRAFQPEGFPYLPRIQNLFNADQYGQDFDISSLPGFFPLAVTGHCTSGLPIFNADGSVDNTPSVSRDCSDYVVLRFNSITTLEQEVAEANMQGGLFDLPAGEVRFALGIGYREENFRFDPDSGYNANQDFPNVIQNIILPVTTEGRTKAKEVYGELIVPILADIPAIHNLEIETGIRYSDYGAGDNVDTYKIMANWDVTDWIGFRGGFQRANRAPNIAELFTPRGGSQIQGLDTPTPDPCANHVGLTPDWGNTPSNPNRLNVQILCQHLMVRDGAPTTLYEPGTPSADDYQFNVFGGTNPFPFTIAVTEGNPELESESADTVTAGLVLNSPVDHPLLDQLSFSVDIYKIEIEDAIGVPNHNSVYQQCVDASFNSLVGSAPGSVTGQEMADNNPFCALIEREFIGNGAGDWGAPRRFKARTINQGGIETKGIDIQLNWGADFSDMGLDFIPGSLAANVLFSKLRRYAISAFPGAEFIDYTGKTFNASYGQQALTTLNYYNGAASVGMRWQYLSSLDPDPGSAAGVFDVNNHHQFDLFARWSVGDGYELRGGIDNLLDAKPEVVGATSTDNNKGVTSPSYDQIGRRFFIGISANF